MILPALPVAKLEELTVPPSRSINEDVLIVTFPASPVLAARAFIILGPRILDLPISSIDSKAFTVTSPPLPLPKVEDAIAPPLKRVRCLVDNSTSPAAPELKVIAEMELITAGSRSETPITCVESETFTLRLPALAGPKERVKIAAPS